MDAVDPLHLSAHDVTVSSLTPAQELKVEIVKALGLPRAEYTESRIARIFARPSYWPSLIDRRPTFLIGGRGTGKTFALRMLAWDGQHELSPSARANEWPALGIYWRLSVLAVSAFKGDRISEEDWIRIFSHWVNLQLVDRLLQFIAWREEAGEETVARQADLRRVATSLGLQPTDTLTSLREAVLDHLASFGSVVNSISRTVPEVGLSMLGEPFRLLLKAVDQDPVFAGRWLTICLDEFENLEPYQQRVFNSLLKHIGDAPYTMKIGVKPKGLRDRHTLNRRESIGEVADYTSVVIVEHNKKHDFAEFAARVCEERFALMPEKFRPALPPSEMLPELSEEKEALMLGGRRAVEEIDAELSLRGATSAELDYFRALPLNVAHLVDYVSRAERRPPLEVLREAIRKPQAWSNKRNNYGYAALFTIRPTSSGPQFRKHYAGWSTFVMLADGNIRYLLDLVSSAFQEHAEQEFDLTVPVDAVTQTRAAVAVGRKMVLDLEGQDDLGAQIRLLVNGIGRVFGVMARQPWGHTPEVNQFRIALGDDGDGHLDRLLDASVMNAAIVEFEGNKRAANSGETRDYDYQLHPIFSPYFVYSHRRKRRMMLTSTDLLDLADRSTTDSAVSRVLVSQKRTPDTVQSNALFEWMLDG